MKGPGPRVYAAVYAALMALLGVTMALSAVDLGPFGAAAAFSIAAFKAILVALYFMHLRYERGLLAVFASAGFVWLGVLALLAYCDYLTR